MIYLAIGIILVLVMLVLSARDMGVVCQDSEEEKRINREIRELLDRQGEKEL
jgi:hypothetical protein